ncbi:MAG: ferrous iron transport protein B [Clostridiales bacterium]|nr:ferrous iron transport protein B [Clostridiales bacterium]
MAEVKIALAGNPNCGKTTMFNELTGASQYVGNWPGVTVEKKEGKLKGHKEVIIEDLPGIYSLSPYTLEEVVSRTYLINEKPDVILNLVDASNLERNLYLTTQLLEVGVPVVVALNMIDLVEKNGDKIDTKKLSKVLGCPVVETSAVSGKGVMEAAEAAIAQTKKAAPQPKWFDSDIEAVLEQLENAVRGKCDPAHERWYAVKLFEHDSKAIEALKLTSSALEPLNASIKALEQDYDDDSESIITSGRYEAIAVMLQGAYQKKPQTMSTSDKIDRIVTNRIAALPIFAVVMWAVYYISINTIGGICTDWVNDVLFGEWIPGAIDVVLEAVGCADWLYSLIQDGIVAGVGAVLGFVPQMMVLFLCLAILEDCGYMARIAFIMDRIFRRFGLSGKSFIPLLIGTGCGVPAIQASRTIENDKDRKMTIMTTTFIPCSAKLPIIALIAGALFPDSSWVAPSAYFVGIGAVIVSGIILKKTSLFAGDPAPFVMELPPYHMPRPKGLLIHMWDRSKAFIKKAGTIILLSTIVIWFLQSFGFADGSFGMVDAEDSILAAIGGVIAVIFQPLGWGHWQAAVGAITGLIAKENVVGTLAQLYSGLEEVSEEGEEIWSVLPMYFTQVSAYSYLVFNLLCAPCFAAIGAVRREMGSGKWTWMAIGWQCGLAYCVSLVIYQFGSLLFDGASFGVGTVAAILVVILFVYLLVRPAKKSGSETLSSVAAREQAS